MVRTASNGIVFRQAIDRDERDAATARCLEFRGAPGCLPASQIGLPEESLGESLNAQEKIGALGWTIALDGNLIVGGSAYALHNGAPSFHLLGIVTWLAEGYRTEQNQRNLWYQTLHDVPQPGCCGNRWFMVAPTDGLDLAIAKEVSAPVSEKASSLPYLTEYVGIPNGDNWPLV